MGLFSKTREDAIKEPFDELSKMYKQLRDDLMEEVLLHNASRKEYLDLQKEYLDLQKEHLKLMDSHIELLSESNTMRSNYKAALQETINLTRERKSYNPFNSGYSPLTNLPQPILPPKGGTGVVTLKNKKKR